MYINLVRRVGVFACLAVGSLAPQRPAPAPLRAGVFRVDITPDTSVALTGYTNPENRLSQGIHDRLYARAFGFGAGGKRLVLVSCDLSALTPGAYYQRIVCDRLGLRPEELWLCATHTHSGPALTHNPEYPHPNNFAYRQRLEEWLVEAVAGALRQMTPARLVVTRGRSAIGGSRRKPVDGVIEMAFNPEGIADHELLALQLQWPGRGTLGVLFNYACHSRSLRAPNRLLSGDVFGIAEQFIEARLASGSRAARTSPIAAAFAGASGDIDPVALADGFDVTPPDSVPTPVRLGQQLGQDVLNALVATSDTGLESAAKPATEPDMGLKSRPTGPTGAHGARAPIVTAARRVLLPSRWGGPPRALDVAVARIGDVAFVGLESEAVVEIGLAIKARSPFRNTFVFTVCNGATGYLPVAHQYAEGGYEVSHTVYAQGAAELLVEETLAMLGAIAK